MSYLVISALSIAKKRVLHIDKVFNQSLLESRVWE